MFIATLLMAAATRGFFSADSIGGLPLAGSDRHLLRLDPRLRFFLSIQALEVRRHRSRLSRYCRVATVTARFPLDGTLQIPSS
jgi:hypothetical protein